MKVTLLIIKFLFIGALFIVSNNNLYLSNPHDFAIFQDYWLNWMENIFISGKEITAYAINSQWLPN